MDAQREYVEALIDGDPETLACEEQWPGARRRHDPVATTPATLLHRLVEQAPEDRREALIDEMVARRPEVFEQR
jgi:hypothetical protein